MLLHPHLEQYFTAIEALRRVAAIMKTWGIQPNIIKRYLESDSDDEPFVFGYSHETRTDTSQLDLSWEVYSDSEHSPIYVRVEMGFADNDKIELSQAIALEYNVSLNEWILAYEDIAEEPGSASRLAGEFANTLGIELGVKRAQKVYEAWDLIAKMAEFYSKRVEQDLL